MDGGRVCVFLWRVGPRNSKSPLGAAIPSQSSHHLRSVATCAPPPCSQGGAPYGPFHWSDEAVEALQTAAESLLVDRFGACRLLRLGASLHVPGVCGVQVLLRPHPLTPCPPSETANRLAIRGGRTHITPGDLRAAAEL
jgi:hypothetical protein